MTPRAGSLATAVDLPAGREAVQKQGSLRGRGRRVAFFLWLALLAQGLIFAIIQPVWSRVDEAQHFHYVQFIAENGALPVEGKTMVSREVLEVSLQSNQWGWRPAGTLSTPQVLDPAGWMPLPEDVSTEEREKWVRRNLWRFSYEAMQPPLYYAANAPVYAALPDDSFIRLYGMRLLAALMASAIVPLTYLIAREAFPDSRLVVYGAPATVLLTQGYALNMSQVTNDALAVPLAAAAILALLRMTGRGLSWRRSLVAGALIGAALLTKLTAIFLLPVALLSAAMLTFYRREKISAALKHLAVITATAGLIISPWIVRNLISYGEPSGAGAARQLMSSLFWSPAVSLQTLRLEELLPTYWFGEPVYTFQYWGIAAVAIGAAMMIAAMGLLFYFSGNNHRQVPDVHIRVLFLALTTVVGLAVIVCIPFGSGIGGIPGRYLYPLMPVLSFLIIFGIDRLLRRERARFVAESLLVWIAVWESVNLLSYFKNL